MTKPVSWRSVPSAQFAASRRQSGAALLEMVVVLPLFLSLGFGMIQASLVWQAKLHLNYGAFMAARQGSLTGIDMDRMKAGLTAGMMAYEPPELDNAGDINSGDWQNSKLDLADGLYNLSGGEPLDRARIYVLNPTHDAFQEYGEGSCGGTSGDCAIPNDNLAGRSRAVGGSGVNIQDANLLKIEVVYGTKLIVPYVDRFFRAILPGDTYKQQLLSHGFLPISTVATVRMQSPATRSVDNEGQIFTLADLTARINTATGG